MRITFRLDDDVAALLDRARRVRNGGLKEVVNAALREGLVQMGTPPATFQEETVSLGRCFAASLDDIAGVLATAEGEHFN
ncbi:MAG: hypothetical protein ABI165_16505 [Bryobacteraceae bacterium]